ncbi:hypothetical protein ABTY20_02640 [Streptomyces sp. NPDC126497]|uniref:hypothetical protein n=1 Tax=Streptomyces sp. NPDC126497 TaxID=3155313 RepID=UPI00331D89E1
MDSERPVCPACGQPVERVVRRHKTLGAWVPMWAHGPCRNPQCRESGSREAAGPPGGAEPGPERKDAVSRTSTQR